MDTLQAEFEVVSGINGSYSSTTKTVFVEVPEASISSRWNDEVGLSYTKAANNNAKKFSEVIKVNFDNLVKLDKSISVEAFNYNAYEIDNYIDGLMVK